MIDVWVVVWVVLGGNLYMFTEVKELRGVPLELSLLTPIPAFPPLTSRASFNGRRIFSDDEYVVPLLVVFSARSIQSPDV